MVSFTPFIQHVWEKLIDNSGNTFVIKSCCMMTPTSHSGKASAIQSSCVIINIWQLGITGTQ